MGHLSVLWILGSIASLTATLSMHCLPFTYHVFLISLKIYVPHLEEKFLAFDGFSLVDASVMHTEGHVCSHSQSYSLLIPSLFRFSLFHLLMPNGHLFPNCNCIILSFLLQVYMETPSHIVQLTAYLYSWLKSALPIDSVSWWEYSTMQCMGSNSWLNEWANHRHTLLAL